MRDLALAALTKARIWPGARKLRCSFCGRDQGEVARLVAGSSAHICDSCIAECVAVLERHGGFDRAGPTQSH